MDTTYYMSIQWNLRIKDTWGPEQVSFTQRFPLFGVSFIGGSTVFTRTHSMMKLNYAYVGELLIDKKVLQQGKGHETIVSKGKDI